MRAVRARIFALLAALVMLLPSGASARTQYYCRMMGRIVASSSCGNEGASQAPSRAQELQAADCCQRLSSSSRSSSVGTRQALRGVAAAALLTRIDQPSEMDRLNDTGSSCAESTQAPLAIGPPLFVLHCSLLS